MEKAEADWNALYSKVEEKPKFNPDTVDLSAIHDYMRFFYS